MDNKKSFILKMPDYMHDFIKQESRKVDISMAEYVRNAISEKIEREK